MNLKKHAPGIVLFIFIVSVSAFIAAIVAAPLRMIPPVPIDAPPLPIKTATQPVSYQVRLVTLDFNDKSYITLKIKREGGYPAPDRLWVHTSFFIPTPYRSWSGAPVEISKPFAQGDEVTVTVAGACPWCRDTRVPRSGYYARVNISTVSGEDAARRTLQPDADITTAYPVLVQVERMAGRKGE